MNKNVIMVLAVVLLIGIGVFVLNYEEIMHWHTFNSIPATPPPEKVNWLAGVVDWISNTDIESAEDYQ